MIDKYQKLVHAFAAIGIHFSLSIDPEPQELSRIKYRQTYSLIDPWDYPKRVRGKIVAVPLIEEDLYEPVAMLRNLVYALASTGVIMQKWDRNDPQQREQLTFLLDEGKMEFLPPEILQVDLGENK